VAALIATANCTAYRAVVEATGELVNSRQLTKRVGWLAALAGQLTDQIITAHWTEVHLDALAAGADANGRVLPAKGWMALRRLGWTAMATVPKGMYVSDRVKRVGEEAAARPLRLALHRRALVASILATWPDHPHRRTDAEWAALRAVLPAGTAAAEIRNRTRQLHSWTCDHDGRLPAGITELELPPRCRAPEVLLAAADKQLTTLTRTSEHAARLRVQLPLSATPARAAHWAWHTIELRLPPTVPIDAALAAPTLRVVGGAVGGAIRVDLPFRQQITSARSDGHSVALGFDWGINTLLTGSIGSLVATLPAAGTGAKVGQRVISDGRRLRFDATAISAKLHRLRQHRETVAARCDHYTRLLTGFPPHNPQHATLQRKFAVLHTEHERICARIRHLNHALAWAAARWAVDQATALGPTVIYLEDLATLEAHGRRGSANARLSGQVRGVVVAAIRHLAAKAGIAMVTVPARGTSKYCPRCLGVVHHAPAPDRADQHGWKWSVCGGCGLSCDRDHAAAERIVSRGLLAQSHTLTDRKTGTRAIRVSVDGPVARARRPKLQRHANQARTARPGPRHRRFQSVAPLRRRGPTTTPRKGRPTPSRPRPDTMATTSKTSTSTFPRAPDRRAAPAPAPNPASPALGAGKRPAGPVPQTHLRPTPQVRSGPAYDYLSQPGRAESRQNGGWGFHRAIRATEAVPLGAFGLPSKRPRLTRNALVSSGKHR